jgi:hypothetical protein
MTMKQDFKEKWLQKLTDGSYRRQRYNLSDDGNARCVMGAAKSVAVEMGIIKEEGTTDRDLLTDEELKAIGLSKEAQFYLSTMNDTYGFSIDKDKFPRRIIQAIESLPVKEDILLLPAQK